MITQQFISREDVISVLGILIEEKVETVLKRDLQEKFLSIAETCNLFKPAISRPTLDKLTRNGILKKHFLGDRPLYKYSEVIQAVKSYEPYKR